MSTENLAFSAAALSALSYSNYFVVQVSSKTSTALSLLEGELQKANANNESAPFTLVKVEPYGDFVKALQFALAPEESPKFVTVISTSTGLLSLLPVVSSLTKATPDSGHFLPKLQFLAGITSSQENRYDISDINAYSDLSSCTFTSSTIQQVYDFSLASALVALKSGPVVFNFFDLAQLSESEVSPVSRDFNVLLSTYSNKIESLKASDFQGDAEMKDESELESSLPDVETEKSESPKLSQEELSNAALSCFENTTYSPVEYYGSSDADTIFVSVSNYYLSESIKDLSGPTGYLVLNQLSPFPSSKVLDLLPKSTKRLVLLEQSENDSRVWGPLVFNFINLARESATYSDTSQVGPVIIDVQSSSSFGPYFKNKSNFTSLYNSVHELNSSKLLKINDSSAQTSHAAAEGQSQSSDSSQKLSEVELANLLPYQKLLETVFNSRLQIVNGENNSTIWGNPSELKTNPEYAFGTVVSETGKRQGLFNFILATLNDQSLESYPQVVDLLTKWVDSYNGFNSNQISISVDLLEALKSISEPVPASASHIIENSKYLLKHSNWIVGSDEWAVDLSNSGIHQALSSGLDINLIILDTTDYSLDSEDSSNARPQKLHSKKDIGLYALNYGNSYVASISAYASYSQSLTSLIEADAFPGPSIVLAHLPSPKSKLISPNFAPIESMKLSKIAVDNGKWPLYRWTPSEAEEGKFVLDSQRLKSEIQQFLDRNNTLTLIANSAPTFTSRIDDSLENKNSVAAAKAAKADLDRLMAGLQGPSITILYASDGSNAAEAATRINRGAKARKMRPELIVMNDFEFSELEYKSQVVFVVSTAGQGEFPTNGKNFWKSLKSASINLSNLKYSVFGLGDRHYWPSEEDKIFYNKPGKDLDKRLFELSGVRLCDAGFGDDSDPNGWEEGFSAWEKDLWSSLGYDASVDMSEALADEPPKISDEDNKIQSNFLRGRIVEELADTSKGDVDEFTGKLLKFHGTYGQDDRDIRDERVSAGLEPAYSFMIRVRLPGGVATRDQWLAMDELSTNYGNQTLKITTRQTFQLHGVLKSNLRLTINKINKALMDTIAACGDVNRNVVSSANPLQQHLRGEVAELAKELSESLLPKSNAFHEIWVADKMVSGQAVQDSEPLYGPAYLPRKFKIGIAIPPENDVDVFAYDLGLIAILNEAEEIIGYNVAVGGGMGMTHNNKKTYPRLGSIFGYIDKKDVVSVCREILTTQRDFGDRKNRKHARLKYTIDDRGVEWFRSQVEERSGVVFEKERPFKFNRNGDRYGWVDSIPGHKNYTMFIQNGRVADLPGYELKSALKQIAQVHKGFFQLTCNSHLILADVPNDQVETIDNLLKKLGVHNKNYTQLRLHSMACTAFPTCGLAMAESERYLPSLVSMLDETIDEAGLRNDAIVIRMTGCPNGCARPYVAEIALVGKAPGTYNLYLGGAHDGSRLNKVYKESIQEEEILEILKPMIKNYALERREGEAFGDYVIRAGIIKETFQGLDFHSQ
ncbi:hypothetical protein BB560_007341 [Smittium megazygosporum]|uniref:assimilatory sulfite reductase (NADPH) n=1 Tax=Smittium megazygosporum TaxID=133381 RepID=A0A2T9XWQ4_9FUNG|nr:hypothetical protein BB560_007341 [Smittium megazygosporum]